jgi:hypothetical protein
MNMAFDVKERKQVHEGLHTFAADQERNLGRREDLEKVRREEERRFEL